MQKSSRELRREMTPAEKNPVTGVTWEQIGSPFAEQDKVLSGVGLRIVRFVNEDVVRNLHEVVERSRELISE